MILAPFDVSSRGKTYTFIDRMAIDSEADRAIIEQMVLVQLELMQDDAKCAALGIDERCNIDNFTLGAYDGAELAGVFLITSMDYRSGPWADLVDWEVIGSGPAVFHARPMPGFPAMSLDASLDLSVEVAHRMMAETINTVGGNQVRFSRFSWALFKDRDDANSRAMQRVHDHAKADARLAMVEVQDPSNSARTRVDIELA